MAIYRAREIREMKPEERATKLKELQNELLQQKAKASSGGAPENPGRLRELRRTIARIKTIQRELGELK